MTEAEWATCDDSLTMLRYLRSTGHASDRKLDLFACACCRRFWPRLGQAHRALLETHEAFADGQANPEEVMVAWEAYWQAEELMKINSTSELPMAVRVASVVHALGGQPAGFNQGVLPVRFANSMVENARHGAEAGQQAARLTVFESQELKSHEGKSSKLEKWSEGREAVLLERAFQASLLRDILGNPFQTPMQRTSWSQPEAISLAETIYARHAFDQMGKLGEVLERARCQDVHVIDHCREPGPHVRGCWVLDGLLGKL